MIAAAVVRIIDLLDSQQHRVCVFVGRIKYFIQLRNVHNRINTFNRIYLGIKRLICKDISVQKLCCIVRAQKQALSTSLKEQQINSRVHFAFTKVGYNLFLLIVMHMSCSIKKNEITKGLKI